MKTSYEAMSKQTNNIETFYIYISWKIRLSRDLIEVQKRMEKTPYSETSVRRTYFKANSI